jgi:hypothetical protein
MEENEITYKQMLKFCAFSSSILYLYISVHLSSHAIQIHFFTRLLNSMTDMFVCLQLTLRGFTNCYITCALSLLFPKLGI